MTNGFEKVHTEGAARILRLQEADRLMAQSERAAELGKQDEAGRLEKRALDIVNAVSELRAGTQ